jgi:hypothetical protein
MTKEIQQTLCKAISDCGYWMWWDYADGRAQLEFGGVLLYDEAKQGKEARSGHIAVRFVGNGFIIFLDDGSDVDLQSDWIEKFHNDELEPFTMDPDELVFDDVAYAEKIFKEYKNKTYKNDGASEASIRNAKHILAGKSGGVGFILGGDEIQVQGSKGKYTPEEIKDACEKWWDYWKEYWKLRGTDEAYNKDYACEVTIPIKKP